MCVHDVPTFEATQFAPLLNNIRKSFKVDGGKLSRRDGKVRFGSVQNGPVLVLEASEPEPDPFFSSFFLFSF